MLTQYAKPAQRCVQENASYETYLSELTGLELDNRDQNAQSRRLKSARLPAFKELADFQFTHVPKLNKAKVLELARSEFVHSNTNIVLAGPPGVGKTHLTVVDWSANHSMQQVSRSKDPSADGRHVIELRFENLSGTLSNARRAD
jgi:DNA replication protein DnaC